MVEVDSDKYAVESFLFCFRDKSEYKLGFYTYDHSSCKGVGYKEYSIDSTSINLVDKGKEHAEYTKLVSLSGDTTITGMKFKDLIAIEKKLDTKVEALKEGSYDVINIVTVNPNGKSEQKRDIPLAKGEFKVTEKTREGVKIKDVYLLKEDGEI